MKKTINLKYFLFIIIFYLFIFQNPLQNTFHVFRYFDEIFALSIIPLYLIKEIKYKNNKHKISEIIIILILICLTGLYSNIKLNIQDFKSIFSDIIVLLKFFLVYMLSNTFFTKEFMENNKKKILCHVHLIIIVLFILSIANYLFNLFPYEIRYGIMSNKLFFSHPTFLVAISVFLISMNTFLSKKIINSYTLMALFIIISTLRFKAIGITVGIILISYYVNKTNKKITVSKLVIIGLIVFLVSFQQISYYFFNTGFARKELTTTAFKIAKDNFPLGTGFASFGSYFSVTNYSPIYYKYNLNSVWGISPQYADFVSDTFWPMILGQFGILGLILYIRLLYIILKNLQNEYSTENKYIYLAKLMCFIYLIISSTSESAFVNPISVPLAFVIGLKVKHISKEKEKSLKKI